MVKRTDESIWVINRRESFKVKLGFIGFGEAAFELSVGLKGEGLETIFAHDVMIDHPTYGLQIKERAASSSSRTSL